MATKTTTTAAAKSSATTPKHGASTTASRVKVVPNGIKIDGLLVKGTWKKAAENELGQVGYILHISGYISSILYDEMKKAYIKSHKLDQYAALPTEEYRKASSESHKLAYELVKLSGASKVNDSDSIRDYYENDELIFPFYNPWNTDIAAAMLAAEITETKREIAQLTRKIKQCESVTAWEYIAELRRAGKWAKLRELQSGPKYRKLLKEAQQKLAWLLMLESK